MSVYVTGVGVRKRDGGGGIEQLKLGIIIVVIVLESSGPKLHVKRIVIVCLLR